MTTPTKLQWCAMLAKLVAPMDAERAAQAFADMLPLLPQDDDRYTRAMLERCARCERKTAVPTFADLERAFAEGWRETLPVQQRMGADVPVRRLVQQFVPDPPEVRAETARKAREAMAALNAEAPEREQPKAQPRFITPLQAALSARANNAPILRPDWMRALAEYDAGNTSEYQGGE